MLRFRIWPRRHPAVDAGDHGRDPSGRLYDGDTVRRVGTERWADLLRVNEITERRGRDALR
jgi:hypothetical protein